MIRIFVMVMSLCVFAHTASAQEGVPYKGHTLLSSLTQFLKCVDTGSACPTSSYVALGYLSGVIDALEGLKVTCLPEQATIGQNVRVVVKYLQAHPEQLHLDSGALIKQAVSEAYPPCRQK